MSCVVVGLGVGGEGGGGKLKGKKTFRCRYLVGRRVFHDIHALSPNIPVRLPKGVMVVGKYRGKSKKRKEVCHPCGTYQCCGAGAAM